MNLKHNKKRNVAFLYESLIKELSLQTIKKNNQICKKIVSILKEFYNKNTEVHKEWNLYKELYETTKEEKDNCKKILNEVKIQHKISLDKKKLFKEQSNLINRINKEIGSSIYNNFVPNYKTLASIYNVLNNGIKIRNSILLENEIIEYMSSKDKEDKEKKNIDGVVVKKFSERYNKEYSRLNEKQKTLLKNHVLSFSDDLSYKLFINEEIKDIKKSLSEMLDDSEIKGNKIVSEQINKVVEKFDECKEKKIDSEMLLMMMKSYSLLEDYKNET